MITALGYSEDIDSADAIDKVLAQCDETLAGRTPQAGLLYAGIDHDHQTLLDAVTKRFPGIQVIGGTTHGELSTKGFAEDSVVLMLFHSDRGRFAAGVGEGVRADPEGAARRAVAMAREGLDASVRPCLAVSEGPNVESDLLVRALGEAAGTGVPVCGSMAGDQLQIKQTYQFCNGRVYSDVVTVMLFAGPLHVATGVSSGWAPMGTEHRVAATEGPFVRRIDDWTARDLWVRYFGTTELSGARQVVAVYPEPEGTAPEHDDFYLSVPFGFKLDGSMFVTPTIPPGARIRFADADRAQVLTGTEVSTARALEAYPGEVPGAVLIFSCAGRHGHTGTQVDREHRLVEERFGPDMPVIGFYTYGEFCPRPHAQTPRAHGCTFVTVLIGEQA